MEIEGKVAVVSGGASGIGRATVIALAERSVKVLVADWDEDGARQTIEMVTAKRDTAIFRLRDLGTPSRSGSSAKRWIYLEDRAALDGRHRPQLRSHPLREHGSGSLTRSRSGQAVPRGAPPRCGDDVKMRDGTCRLLHHFAEVYLRERLMARCAPSIDGVGSGGELDRVALNGHHEDRPYGVVGVRL